MQATDNSIYQRLPQAVICPRKRTTSGCWHGCSPSQHIATSRWRGGGTGTNGQSLTDGVVVDLSRNMNRILEIDVEQRWVRVQAGVVRISSTRR